MLIPPVSSWMYVDNCFPLLIDFASAVTIPDVVTVVSSGRSRMAAIVFVSVSCSVTAESAKTVTGVVIIPNVRMIAIANSKCFIIDLVLYGIMLYLLKFLYLDFILF